MAIVDSTCTTKDHNSSCTYNWDCSEAFIRGSAVAVVPLVCFFFMGKKPSWENLSEEKSQMSRATTSVTLAALESTYSVSSVAGLFGSQHEASFRGKASLISDT